MTRRDVLKRGAALGLAIPTVSALLAACEGPEDADDEDVAAEEPDTDDEVEEVEEVEEPDDDADEVEADDDPMDVDVEDVDIGSDLIGELEGPEVVDEMPDSFNESPELAEMVEAGELPPVEERIGSQPMVVRPVHEIGEYGGTWRRAFTGPGDHENGNRIMSSDKPLFWDYTGSEVKPSLAREWEVSDEGRVTTLHLREGMHWSDGEPFTSADFMWWFDHIYENSDLTATKNPETAINGQQGYIEADGDYTVRFVFPEPYPMFVDVLAGSTQIGGGHATRGRAMMGAYAPGHYLEQFHPDFVGEDEAQQIAEDAGFDNWVTYFEFLNDWSLNVDLPTVTPWKTVSPINEPNWVLERNPYYWAVDTEGNQLPYIDTIIMRNAEDLEVVTLRAIAGEIDKQGRHMELPALPVFLENQEAGDYTVRLDRGLYGGDANFSFNMSYRGDEGLADLMNNRDFRRAISLGIQRDQLNEALWLGLGTPGSPVPADHMPQNPGPEWRDRWSTFDPDQANELLDGIGLDERDAEGYRLRPDNGERLRIRVAAVGGAFIDWPAVSEMVAFQVGENVGVQLDLQELERSLFWERVAGNELEIAVWMNDGSEHLFIYPQHALPATFINAPMGSAHAIWWQTDGAEGVEPPDEMKRAQDLFASAFGVESDEERDEIAKEIWELLVEEQWSVGTVGLSPAAMGLRIVGNHMGNIPSQQANGQHVRTPCSSHPPTFFIRSS
ncbi:MAG: ABC transporter substrate-binding protein [Sphaerobacteraceae bacterium]|nr:MAG: ABC transporter substrate-binding protein [Sphaerobacteraceae bacterium]